MKFCTALALLLLTLPAAAQETLPREKDMFARDIEKNVYRLHLGFQGPQEDYIPLVFSYERELKRPFTLLLKAGGAYTRDAFGPVDNPTRISVNAYGAAEARWYWNLGRRIRKEKAVRNFSANYLALEQVLMSNPVLFINQERDNGACGFSATYLNLGLQRQVKSFYYGFFIGPRVWGRSFDRRDASSLGEFKAGVVVGLALN